jgi:hypothetical protein
METILQRKLPQVYSRLSLPQGEVVEGEECKALEDGGGRQEV